MISLMAVVFKLIKLSFRVQKKKVRYDVRKAIANFEMNKKVLINPRKIKFS